MGAENPDKDDATEVLERVNRLLSKLERPSKPESKFRETLNSAFTVTFIGGIMVALIGWGLQTMTGHHEKELQEARQERDSKERVAFDFANSFPLTLDLASRMRGRYLWLKDQETKKTEQRYVDGRSFEQTRDYYEKCLDEYLARPPLASSYNQVIAAFTNSMVIGHATNLFTRFNALLLATNRTEVDRKFGECEEEYRELTKYMFQEVLKTK